MSFDDGFGGPSNSGEDFRAKFVAAWQEKGFTFEELCLRAGVAQKDASRAIELGSGGLPATLPVLQRLLSALGLDEGYLFSAQSDFKPRTPTDRRRAARTLAWDFALRPGSGVAREHRSALALYCADLVSGKPSSSMVRAARPQVLRTTLDIAFEYKRLVAQGYFNRKRP